MIILTSSGPWWLLWELPICDSYSPYWLLCIRSHKIFYQIPLQMPYEGLKLWVPTSLIITKMLVACPASLYPICVRSEASRTRGRLTGQSKILGIRIINQFLSLHPKIIASIHIFNDNRWDLCTLFAWLYYYHYYIKLRGYIHIYIFWQFFR